MRSTNEVNDHQMEDNVSEDKVGESPLLTQFSELVFVLRIDLQPKTDAQHERRDRRYEAREECVERKCAHKTAVQELDHSRQQDVQQVGVD